MEFEYCDENRRTAEVCIEATGLLKQIRSRQFMWMSPADKLLQEHECDILTGVSKPMIECFVQNIKAIRDSNDVLDHITLKLDHLHLSECIPTWKRKRRLPTRMSTYVTVETAVGHTDHDDTDTITENESTLHRRLSTL